MNKEDIKRAIDLIEPEPYMETRLKAKSIPKKTHSRAFGRAAAGAVALCLVFAVMLGVNLPSPTVTPTTEGQTEAVQQMRQISPFIMVAGAVEAENEADGTEYEALKLNEAFSFVYKISVTDTREMSQEEKEKEIKRLSRIFEDTVINEASGRFESACGVVRGGFENIIFTEIMYNKIVLDIKEKESLKSINVKNSSEWGYIEYDAPLDFEEAEETGMLTVLHGNDLTVTADKYNDSNGFIWRNSDKLDNAINDNPDIPLSTFKDTITFTVEYIDGTKEIGVIDVTFDDEGNGAFTLKEYKEG